VVASALYAIQALRDSEGWYYTKAQFSSALRRTFVGLSIETKSSWTMSRISHAGSRPSLACHQKDVVVKALFLDWLMDMAQKLGRRPSFGWWFVAKYYRPS
jgi:hypothetical protein